MVTNSELITAPILMSEIKTIISGSSYSLKDLNTSSSINMWSLAKPIDADITTRTVDTIDSSGNITRNLNSWYRNGGTCGITITTHSSPYDCSLYDWYYYKPTSKYRMGDWDGYWKNAPQPYASISVPSSVVKGGSVTMTATRNSYPSYGSNNYHRAVELSDIYISAASAYLSSFKIGFAAKTSGGTQLGYALGSSLTSATLSSFGSSLSSSTASAIITPFLYKGSVYIGLPNISTKTISITAASASISITLFELTTTSYSFTVAIYDPNGSNSSATYSSTILITSGAGLGNLTIGPDGIISLTSGSTANQYKTVTGSYSFSTGSTMTLTVEYIPSGSGTAITSTMTATV